MPVALNAGIGGASGFVTGYELVHDIPAEIILEIEHIERHSQPERNAAGIGYIVQAAAGAVLIFGKDSVGKQAHGGADTVQACLLGQICCYGTVHTAAHGDHSFGRFHIGTTFSLLQAEYISRICTCQPENISHKQMKYSINSGNTDYIDGFPNIMIEQKVTKL